MTRKQETKTNWITALKAGDIVRLGEVEVRVKQTTSGLAILMFVAPKNVRIQKVRVDA